ncbi:methyltransferase domain-containing protein, partial [Candidatus Falkowbacteria bacterium]|nr:methyltransferase domain-containing protein [Candidatus Falkowbacteria bacterium]
MTLDQEFLEILCCPKRLCRGDLSQCQKEDKVILECQSCGDVYPVKNGVPILFPNLDFSPHFNKRHWDLEINAESYASKYNSYLKKQGTPWGLYTHVSELRALDKLIKSVNFDFEGKVILDCGSGNGRLLSEYSKAKTKIGIDTSLSLLLDNKRREPDFWLVCGQLEDMPFKDSIADFSASVRVFQHIRASKQAFAEMARVTKPSGYVSLELYNKLNLKELYKRFRMSKLMDKIWPWGLDYDAYYSYRDIEKWCGDNFVKPIKYSGAGWGIHFYLFEPLRFRGLAPKPLQKLVYDLFLLLEDIVGTWPVFSKTLEKICFIGSIQAAGKKKTVLKKINNRFIRFRQRKAFNLFQKVLMDRNHALVGSDRHHLNLTVNWLKKAQDITPDAGVSRGFSFIKSDKSNNLGWQPSYPETTGYIIPTFIKAGKLLADPDLIRRARRMADWLNQAVKSAGWMLKNEYNKEGRWIDNNASSVDQKRTTYNIYAVPPLAKLALLANSDNLKSLAIRVGDFTVSKQEANGWFSEADFEERDDYLLHTIAYTIDGLWDTGELLNEERFLNSAKKALAGVISASDEKGRIPGRLNSTWQGESDWLCLTGLAQIGVTCVKVYHRTQEEKYLDLAKKIKEFLKTCQN